MLLRYLLPVGLARAPQGDVFARAAVERDNRARLRRWLPHYARVHATLAAVALGLCVGCTDCLSPGIVSTLFGALGAIELAVAIVFAGAALALRLE